jgi:hypothetical protein
MTLDHYNATPLHPNYTQTPQVYTVSVDMGYIIIIGLESQLCLYQIGAQPFYWKNVQY